MNSNNLDKQKIIDAIVGSSGGKISRNQLNSIADKKDVSSLISALPEEDRKKLNAALSDKDSLNRLLESPQARNLLNSFLKGKGK